MNLYNIQTMFSTAVRVAAALTLLLTLGQTVSAQTVVDFEELSVFNGTPPSGTGEYFNGYGSGQPQMDFKAKALSSKRLSLDPAGPTPTLTTQRHQDSLTSSPLFQVAVQAVSAPTTDWFSPVPMYCWTVHPPMVHN